MRKSTFALFFPILFFACILLPSSVCAEKSAVVKPQKSIALGTPETCGACHTRILQEWSGAMHAKADPEKDPIVGAYYKYFSEKKIDTGKCDKCHAPIRALYPVETKGNMELKKAGVNCIFCHSIYGKNPGEKHGIDFYKLDLLKSPAGASKNKEKEEAHNAEFVGIFKHVDICAGCHQGGETDYYAKGKPKTLCQQCHMPTKKNMKLADDGPVREKVYRHLFEGGHSETLLNLAASVEGGARKENDKTILNLSVENFAVHDIPAGFPLRAIYLKVVGLDKNQKPVWSNYEKDPKTEDPSGYFALHFQEEDEPYVHYVKDVKPIKDTRLKASAIEELTYEVPSDKVETFQVRLYYRLLPKSVIQKLEIEGEFPRETLMFEATVYVN